MNISSLYSSSMCNFFVFPRFFPAKCGMRNKGDSADLDDCILKSSIFSRQKVGQCWKRRGGQEKTFVYPLASLSVLAVSSSVHCLALTGCGHSIPGAKPENSERGGRKMSWRERGIAPYPKHMTGILKPIENTTRKTVGYKKLFKKSEKGWGTRRGPLTPSKSAHVFYAKAYQPIE